ncbi:MAG: hypothetical protein M3Y65_11735 [Pseudomonadota bacterium]|nr:hypothetical protein [Pseudomonadota bacterium]
MPNPLPRIDNDLSGAVLRGKQPLGALERMPKWLIIVPLVCQWLYLSMRFGGLTVPAAANPAITAGGLVGEGKLEYFAQMGPIARAATATSIGFTVDRRCDDTARLHTIMGSAGLSFPVIAKPDLGMCGYGVRRIDNPAQLRAYVHAFPDGESVVLQRYLSDEGEAGIFYARDPVSGTGRIIGLALRYFPQVHGDGVRTVAQLMHSCARVQRGLGRTAHQCVQDTAAVPAVGETVRLSTIGSTRVGGLYLDGSRLITPALTNSIDAIARDMGEFHFGRFDVRFNSEEALQCGRGFTIMEVNGAGSEAIQAWDPSTHLNKALRTIFAKQRLLFEIGAANCQRGVRPIGLLALARLNAAQNRLLDAYPPSN